MRSRFRKNPSLEFWQGRDVRFTVESIQTIKSHEAEVICKDKSRAAKKEFDDSVSIDVFKPYVIFDELLESLETIEIGPHSNQLKRNNFLGSETTDAITD